MKSTRDRIEDLERSEFDSWGEQDKGPSVQPLATPEEVRAIHGDIWDHPWDDPARFPVCLNIAVSVLGEIATGDSAAAHQATQALRRMAQRVAIGEDIRPGQDMALPRDYPDPRWRETLDDEDLT